MDNPHTRITANAHETKALGREVARSIKQGVLLLHGDLGSGKTTFTQGFAEGLGITERLLSPTFIIVRRYELPSAGLLYHLDLYRVQHASQLAELGLDEMSTDTDSYIVVEWPEKMEKIPDRESLDIYFTVLADGNHEIRIEHN